MVNAVKGTQTEQDPGARLPCPFDVELLGPGGPWGGGVGCNEGAGRVV